MEHMINSYLKEKEVVKSSATNLRETIPPKSQNVHFYILEQRYKTDPIYAKSLDESVKKLDERVKNMAPMDMTMSKWATNGSVLFWRDEREEMIKEIKQYIPLSIQMKQDSCFHNVALGLWNAWGEGYIQDNLITELVQCINKQIIITGESPKFNEGEKNKGGASPEVDRVEILMNYVHLGANASKTARKLKRDPSDLRKYLKETVGNDHKNILKPDHKYYEMTQVAYKYWLAESKEVK